MIIRCCITLNALFRSNRSCDEHAHESSRIFRIDCTAITLRLRRCVRDNGCHNRLRKLMRDSSRRQTQQRKQRGRTSGCRSLSLFPLYSARNRGQAIAVEESHGERVAATVFSSLRIATATAMSREQRYRTRKGTFPERWKPMQPSPGDLASNPEGFVPGRTSRTRCLL